MNRYLRSLRESFRHCFDVLICVAILLLLGASPAYAQDQMGSGSVLNILMLGVIAYYLVRMFRRRMGGGDKRDDTRPGRWSSKEDEDKPEKGGRVIRPMDRHEVARQMWNQYSSDRQEAPSVKVPEKTGEAGFDEGEFLEGAKLFFSRFQQASDSRDFEELKVFLSDEVYADAVLASQNKPAGSRTEVMLLNAKLMELKSEEGKTRASVFYDGQLRIGVGGEQTNHIRTVWEYVRDDNLENGLWTLEKINKVDQ